jgi:tetratricopeptide (TPR) repeat protein
MSDDSRLGDLRRRVEADPASIAFAGLAEEYRRAGRHEEAVAVCRVGLTRHPAYVSARVTLGRALLALGEMDAAEAELQKVLTVAPENLAAVRALSDIHQQRRQAAATAAAPIPTAVVANVIPFEADPMPLEFNTFDAPDVRRTLATPASPVLSSLDRFLDAIVTLKRAV